MLRQFFIYICIRVLPTDLLPTLLMWLWCLNIFTQCQLFFNSSSKFVPFLSKIFIKFQEGISISRQTFPHFNLSDVRRDDDNNAMKEESWIWETGSRINLRLAEVWAEKAEIGKNCWHWFPPAFLAILWTANKQARSEVEISRQFHFPYWKIKVFSISEV